MSIEVFAGVVAVVVAAAGYLAYKHFSKSSAPVVPPVVKPTPVPVVPPVAPPSPIPVAPPVAQPSANASAQESAVTDTSTDPYPKLSLEQVEAGKAAAQVAEDAFLATCGPSDFPTHKSPPYSRADLPDLIGDKAKAGLQLMANVSSYNESIRYKKAHGG